MPHGLGKEQSAVGLVKYGEVLGVTSASVSWLCYFCWEYWCVRGCWMWLVCLRWCWWWYQWLHVTWFPLGHWAQLYLSGLMLDRTVGCRVLWSLWRFRMWWVWCQRLSCVELGSWRNLRMIVSPLCDEHVHHVLLRVCGFRLPLRVKCLGKRDLYWWRGIVLTSTLELTFMGKGLQPCLVTNCKVFWNVQWPLGALLV